MSVYMNQLATGRYYGFIDFRVFNYLTFLYRNLWISYFNAPETVIEATATAYSINGLILVFVTRIIH